jgi:hypothetical protein
MPGGASRVQLACLDQAPTASGTQLGSSFSLSFIRLVTRGNCRVNSALIDRSFLQTSSFSLRKPFHEPRLTPPVDMRLSRTPACSKSNGSMEP